MHKVSFLLLMAAVAMACSDNEPKKEDVPEMITKVKLTFTPSTGTASTVTATDPDGEGVQDLVVNGEINLKPSTSYLLTISLENGLAEPTSDDFNVTAEVEDEGDEHLFLFGWTGNVFSDPSGDGNIDRRSDAVNYTGGANSVDRNNLPLGLTTSWTSSANPTSGNFRLVLKHQPQLKSASSGADVGETDLDVTFPVKVQ